MKNGLIIFLVIALLASVSWGIAEKVNNSQLVNQIESIQSQHQKEIQVLKEQLENLKNPPPQLDWGEIEIIGTLSEEELWPVLKKFYPKACYYERLKLDSKTYEFRAWNIKIVDSKYQLVSVDVLKNFLAADDTDRYRHYKDYHDCDDFAFRLKGQWIRAGFSSCPLGLLVRGKKEGPHFLNLFVTKEDGKIVLYEVEPQTDKITKVTQPNLETFFIII